MDIEVTDDPVRAMVLTRMASLVQSLPSGLPDGQVEVIWPSFLAALSSAGVDPVDVSGWEGIQLGVLLSIEMLASDEVVLLAVAERMGSEVAKVLLLTYCQLLGKDLGLVLERMLDEE